MEFLLQFLSLATSAIDAALWILFFHTLLSVPFSSKRSPLLWALLGTAICVVMDMAGQPHIYKSVLSVVWGFAYCHRAMKQKAGPSAFLSLLFMAMLYVCETMVMGLSGRVFPNDALSVLEQTMPYQIFCMAVSRGVLFVVVGLLLTLSRRRKMQVDSQHFNRPYWVLLCAGVLTFWSIVALLNYSLTLRPDITRHVLPLISAVLIAIGALFLILAIRLSRGTEKQYRLQTELMQAEQRLRQQDEQQAMYGKLQGLRHDFKNHLQIMGALAAQNRTAELQKYIAGMEQTLLPDKNEVHTENPYIDALLSTKIALAGAHGIIVHAEICFPLEENALKITDAELCTVLFNLLDNAIEACDKNTQAAHKEIWLKLAQWRGFLRVECKNASEAAPQQAHGGYKSSKSGELHGIGLRQIQTLAEKYEGLFETTYADGVFEASLLLANAAPTEQMYVANITAAPQETGARA